LLANTFFSRIQQTGLPGSPTSQLLQRASHWYDRGYQPDSKGRDQRYLVDIQVY